MYRLATMHSVTDIQTNIIIMPKADHTACRSYKFLFWTTSLLPHNDDPQLRSPAIIIDVAPRRLPRFDINRT